uniref:Putative RNA-directed DNA polymerase n=1 Tax=Sipha flava TaxID=143950 RepID=A0A2S2PXS8_9HEMI
MHLPPKNFSPGEVYQCIKSFPSQKSPGYDLITAEICQLPKKAILMLTYILNATIRLSYFPLQWKFFTIILIHKSNKPQNLPSSYRPISLLPFFSKVCEKLVLKRICPIIVNKKIIPEYQFSFRERHSILHQIHRLVDLISLSLERKMYCSAIKLDISQAFDRIWHPGLLLKLHNILPLSYFLFFKNYLENRSFSTRVGNDLSPVYPINAGVPQDAISSPLLFNIYTSDQPTNLNTHVANYADDKILIAVNKDPNTTSTHLQSQLNGMHNWFLKWRVKLNESKSCHTTFTLYKKNPPQIYINNIQIPTNTQSKYLGLILDKRLTWSPHIHSKKLAINLRTRMLQILLNNQTKTSLHSKLIIYKSLIKPMWTYGIELWGAAKISNTNKIQTVQSKNWKKLHY